ncbi:MAG TPA: glycosyltransferase family 2 protein [Candidatus Acidoferrum sp.]|nr:glycosyltransferase family 2 protein [Candidatus Acidoferrum sp.]
MIDKVDLVMWTKNGAQTLPIVLKRINEAIPQEFVNKKIIVDDASTDATPTVATSFGWSVIPNKGHGISDGANTALEQATADFFVSFEQDLLLALDWWRKIPPLLEKSNVAVASGMRFADKPVGVKKMQEYVGKKYRGESKLAPWLKSRDMSAFTLGKTLDNTIYKTKIIRALGGFPKLRINAGVDTTLAYKIDNSGYKWIVDYNMQSIHLRKGLRQELNHQYWYGTQLYEIWRKIGTESNKPPPVTKLGVIRRFCISPFTGLFIAIQTKESTIMYIHPLVRFYYMKGLLQTSKIE